MNKCVERVYNGIIKENPTFILMLGMCPTLAVTTSAINGLGMGLSTTAVLIFSNLIIAALRHIIPDRVRIPAFIVIVATLVTIVQLLIQGFVPSLYSALGIYIPLIVVNCIILGRAESYAAKNDAVSSAFDGLGMGLGFTLSLTCIGIVREFISAGAFFGMEITPEDFHISIFGLAPGAFFVLAGLSALQNKFKLPSATNGDAPKSELACGGDCMHCSGSLCASNHAVLEAKRAEEMEKAAAAKKAAAEKAAAAKKAAAEKAAAEAAGNKGQE
ncbi:MAG TPA: electron transport complex subunit E [Candidatus Lachnoclostridium stercoravium]|uniref:Ion-translocating oxidoreductase complex subunit E n=1 Tax=Candidatus Lachnoclostridium stercoravium TaxID=2838633 RepID=A0A9D2HGP6_9FIRM|nr:electron transport complex subunit E [Candidatus Lachnoclostridium stercoravium]